MKKYLLITSDKFKFEITEAQKAAIIKAINRGDKLLEIQDSVISLAITPTIVEYSRWFAQENERLALANKRLCKKCHSIMDSVGGCTCWDRMGGADKNPLMLPDSIKKIIHDGVRIGGFPKPTEDEIYAEEGTKYLESKSTDYGEVDYMLDENGEKLYS